MSDEIEFPMPYSEAVETLRKAVEIYEFLEDQMPRGSQEEAKFHLRRVLVEDDLEMFERHE